MIAGTNLLGVGSAISALDYNKITLNKPTNFQSDWTSTIINKPSTFPADMTNIYNKTEVNNISVLNNYPSYTALNNSNYAKYSALTTSNYVPFTALASCNYITNSTSGLTNYSTTGNDTNYLLKTGGTMTGAIVNTSTTTSEFKGIQFAHTARISHIPYLPDGKIYFRAPVIIDNPDDYLSFGSRIGDNIIRLYDNSFGFGINGGTLRYNVPAGSVHRFYHGTTNTAWIDDTGRLKATIFEGSGASLTNVPYASITSVPDFLLKSGGTLTGTLNGTTINATTALQEAGTNLILKYLQLSGGSMTANANITLSGTGTFTGNHSGNGSALTNLPLSGYSLTGQDTNYVLKSGSTMTGTLNGTTIYTTGNIGVGTNNNIASLVVGNIDADGSDGSIAFSKRQNVGTKRNFKMGMNGDYTFCIGDYGSGNTANTWSVNHFNIRYADGNVGIGIQASGSYKLYVDGTTYFNGNSTINGTCSATTFSGSGANLTNLPLSSYSTTGNDNSYLLKTGGVMTGQITGVSTLNATTGIFGTISTTNNTNLNTPQLGAFGGTGDKLILYVGTASIHPYSLGMNSSTLWYSVPAGTSHIFYVGGSSITTISSTGLSTTGLINASTNIQENGVNISSKYLKLDGTNSMTGDFTINKTNANIQLGGTNGNNFAIPSANGYFSTSALAGDMVIRSINNLHLLSGGGVPAITIRATNNNVGIATTDPETKLDVNGSILLRTALATSGGTGGIFFRNGYTSTSVYNCSILTYDHNADTFCDGISINGYDGVSICTGLNTRQERMRINVSGNVGIGTTDPQTKLEIFHATNPKIFLNQNGTTRCFVSATSLGLDLGNDVGTSKIIRFMPDNVEKMRIDASGNVNIVNTLQIASVDINNWLFNNSGRNHGVYQDFNAIDKFGYSFIQNSTNGPGTDTQYYSWYIGLGNEYPFANSVNGYYGMQFAVGRFETYPKLSIRRKQANAWTGWEGLTAERAVSLTSGDKTISGELTANQSYLGGLRINGGDTNTLYNYGRDLGLLVNSGQSINFNMWGGNGNIMSVNNSGVVIDVDGVPINITNKGIVIGSFGTQYYPFIVNRTLNGTLSYVYVRTGWNGGSDYNTNSITGDTSASFAGQIHVSGNILNSSDIRIKKEINDITDDGALQQILSIQPKTYKYIDYLSKNNGVVYGFIAQQVKEVIPHAVELVKDIIPNIYKRASCDSNIITLENDVSQELNINDNIKIYDEFGNNNIYNILEINENVITIDKDINTSNVFVFGKEVDDFHTLKKDYIFTLNVCATQELYKLIQKQNEVIENLQLQINELKNK